MKDFNWESLRFFLALARCSTPSAAASLLHVDHNTVRRRVAILEKELDTKLLVKRDDEYCLTPEGAVLMEAAEKIESLASLASKEIVGKDFEVTGTVRVAAPDGLATFFLAPRLPLIRENFPKLNIELSVPSRQSKLSKREADIAITVARPGDMGWLLPPRDVAEKESCSLGTLNGRSAVADDGVANARPGLGIGDDGHEETSEAASLTAPSAPAVRRADVATE